MLELMMNKLRYARDELLSSYWFVPTLMALSSAILAFIVIRIDEGLDTGGFRELSFVYYNEPAGARSLVTAIASSMITVASTIFSITLAVLSLTSSQFGSRLLNNFMRDTGNQVVLGTFVSTYIYCLLIVRTIREGGELSGDQFVPHLAIILAILFALASLGVFIYFIHHTAQSIQVSNITTNVAGELTRLIDKTYPNERKLNTVLWTRPSGPSTPVEAPSSHYLQGTNEPGLVRFAEEHDVVLEVLHHVGEFLLAGQPVIRVWGELEEDLHKPLLRNLTFGARRNPSQDLDFLFDQLSEMALRALSPSTNDAVTAMRCTDRIAQGLKHLSSKERPTQHHGEGDVLRLIVPELDLAHLVRNTFGETRRFSSNNMLYSAHLLDTMGTLLELTNDPKLHEALRNEAYLLVEGARKVVHEKDLEHLSARYQSLSSVLLS